jgi:uncharacterized protein (DUF1015 family)
MSIVRPFAGLRPPRDRVLSVACPPYDVVNTEEARALALGNPRSFFHISRPEIDLPPSADPHSEAVHALGLANLRRFEREGTLARDAAPRFYLYRQRMGAHVQTGLVAAASVEEYQRGLIKRHELTRADKEDDRTRHIDVLGANDEPVFLTYRAHREIDAAMERLTARQPEYDFCSEDGIGHTFWVVENPGDIASLQTLFAALPALYIADGHHRSAAAARVRDLRKGRGAQSGDAEHDFFLAVIFPHDQMQILAYNRVVRDLNGLSPEAFLERLAERFEPRSGDPKNPTRLGEFGVYLRGRWLAVAARAGSSIPGDPVSALDVSVLQANLLAPVLGIKDPRTDPRIDFVGGIRGTAELERRVNSGEMQVAFSMVPTRIDQLLAIADAGQIMPPKSTWFEPKLRSGLVIHEF